VDQCYTQTWFQLTWWSNITSAIWFWEIKSSQLPFEDHKEKLLWHSKWKCLEILPAIMSVCLVDSQINKKFLLILWFHMSLKKYWRDFTNQIQLYPNQRTSYSYLVKHEMCYHKQESHTYLSTCAHRLCLAERLRIRKRLLWLCLSCFSLDYPHDFAVSLTEFSFWIWHSDPILANLPTLYEKDMSCFSPGILLDVWLVKMIQTIYLPFALN